MYHFASGQPKKQSDQGGGKISKLVANLLAILLAGLITSQLLKVSWSDFDPLIRAAWSGQGSSPQSPVQWFFRAGSRVNLWVKMQTIGHKFANSPLLDFIFSLDGESSGFRSTLLANLRELSFIIIFTWLIIFIICWFIIYYPIYWLFSFLGITNRKNKKKKKKNTQNKKKKKKTMGGKKLFPISNIILNLVPAAFSFFSEFKLAYHPLHYVWEFLTIHWCVWNSLLTAFYNWRELHGKKQSSLGIVVAISNFVNTFVFSITFIVKRDLIGRGRSWYWWSYSLVWHYLAPILAIIYFFCRAKISPPKFLKKRNKKAFLSFLGTVILHPALFTLANFLRKWIIVFRREEIFLKEIPIPNTEIVLKFKKFMVLWFSQSDVWLKEIWGGDLTKIFPILGYIFLTMFLFWLIGYSLVKIKIKYFSLPGNKDQFSPPEKALATLAIAVAKPEKKLRAARTTTNLRKTTENHCY